METTFFASVASHNLERFHSECLKWLFNTNPNYAKQLIQSITKAGTVDFLLAETEVEQLDLVLCYTDESKTNKALIVENKVKAAESWKKITGKEFLNSWKPHIRKELEELLITDKELVLSQTEYYYIRPVAKKNAGLMLVGRNDRYTGICIADNPVMKGYLTIKKEDCTFLFLLPACLNQTDVKQLAGIGHIKFPAEHNHWRAWPEPVLKKNPWRTITYEELLSAFCEKSVIQTKLKNAGLNATPVDESISLSYLDFLLIQAAKWKAELLEQFIQFDPVKYGAGEYFRLLAAMIADRQKKTALEINVSPGSSNNPSPLMDIRIKTIPVPDIKESGFSLIKISDNSAIPVAGSLAVGIQVQGNVVKLFLSAGEHYDTTTIKEGGKENYTRYFRKLLTDKGILQESAHGLPVLLINDTPCRLSENKPDNKTFLSYSFDITNLKKMSVNKKGKPLTEKYTVQTNIISRAELINTLVEAMIKGLTP